MLRLAPPSAPAWANGAARPLPRPIVRGIDKGNARNYAAGARSGGGAAASRVARPSGRQWPVGGRTLLSSRTRRPCEAIRGLWTLHGPHKASNTCQLPDPLPLAHGGRLREVTVKWEQWGDPTLPGERTVVVMPSFSHGSHVCSHAEDPSPGWWQGFVGPGCPVDTNHFRVIAASILGSPFGTTGPLTPMPETAYEEDDLPEWTVGGSGAPPSSLLHRTYAGGAEEQSITHYGPRFPVITPADQAACHAALLDHLGIPRVHAVIGGSLGGMQVLQFAARYPERTARAVAIACTGRTTPSTVAVRRIQRQAITTDPAFSDGFYDPRRSPVTGLRLARELGMIGYRSREEFDARFDWGINGPLSAADATFEVEQYLQYQGTKFSGHFDANCYLALSKAMDLMDLSDEEGSFVGGVRRIRAKTLLLGVEQDILTPPQELRAVHRILAARDEEERLAAAAAAAAAARGSAGAASEGSGGGDEGMEASAEEGEEEEEGEEAAPATPPRAGPFVLDKGKAPVVTVDLPSPAASLRGCGEMGTEPAYVRERPSVAYDEKSSPFGHDAMFHGECFDWFGTRVRQHLEEGIEHLLRIERVHTTGLSLP